MVNTPETRAMEDVEDVIEQLHDVVEQQADVIEEMEENQKDATRMAYISAVLTLVITILTAINVSVAIGII